ncbi:hypothetical protein F2Q68_00024202 [Brassica cretica]|uniref:Uncharacterized protein n=1 Tax=Brassica cretica TaxID=69181 RepID=A0A8S9IEU7_BRACR|nr:hypothetical protein F2Q68_00024202 [Brassica cretica]
MNGAVEAIACRRQSQPSKSEGAIACQKRSRPSRRGRSRPLPESKPDHRESEPEKKPATMNVSHRYLCKRY